MARTSLYNRSVSKIRGAPELHRPVYVVTDEEGDFQSFSELIKRYTKRDRVVDR